MFMRRLVLVFCLIGCTPSPEVVTGGSGRELWNADATRTPPEPDGDVTSVDPPGQGGQGGEAGQGGPGGEAGTDLPPDADSPPTMTDASYEPRDAGRPTDLRSPDVPPTTGATQTCTLSFQVTTVTFGGSYAPRNVGAIWISDANNRFVKSLTVWGQKRRSHLVTWESASNGNTVDAITSATAGSHGTRMGKWNCTGLDEKPVTDGPYRVNVEFTERNSEGKVMMALPFQKSAAPVSAMPPDQANFKSIRLQVTSP
jgi:hypothetical protein